MKKPVVLNKKKKYSDKAKKAYFSGKGDFRTDLENMIVMRLYEIDVYEESE